MKNGMLIYAGLSMAVIAAYIVFVDGRTDLGYKWGTLSNLVLGVGVYLKLKWRI